MKKLNSKKPISLAILEQYFSSVCSSLTTKNEIDPQLLSKSEPMKEVLKDCLAAIHDLSLEIYILMSSCLKDIEHIYLSSDFRFSSILINKLLKISVLIEDNKYRSAQEPAFQGFTHTEESEDPKDLSRELDVRVSRITARILNLWKKIVTPQKESGIICCSFLLLYCEIDKSINISHSIRVKYDRAVNLMKEYSANPGYVVTVVRKTRDYIEKELISPEIVKRIHEALVKISYEQVRNADNTFTALALYDLELFAVRYYQELYKKRYSVDIFDKSLYEPKKLTNMSEKTFGFSQSENFGIVLSVDSPRGKPRGSLSPQKPRTLNSIRIKSLSKTISPSKPAFSFPSTENSQNLHKIRNFISKSPAKAAKRPLNKEKRLKNEPSPAHRCLSNRRMTFVPRLDIVEKSPEATSRTNSSFSPRKAFQDSVDHGDLLEEMQYQQFIEEKFRNFLVSKLNDVEFDDSLESRIKNEEKLIRNREGWMKEFEMKIGVIRFNAIRKLGDEKRFTAELIRAQKQLEIMERKFRS